MRESGSSSARTAARREIEPYCVTTAVHNNATAMTSANARKTGFLLFLFPSVLICRSFSYQSLFFVGFLPYSDFSLFFCWAVPGSCHVLAFAGNVLGLLTQLRMQT